VVISTHRLSNQARRAPFSGLQGWKGLTRYRIKPAGHHLVVIITISKVGKNSRAIESSQSSTV